MPIRIKLKAGGRENGFDDRDAVKRLGAPAAQTAGSLRGESRTKLVGFDWCGEVNDAREALTNPPNTARAQKYLGRAIHIPNLDVVAVCELCPRAMNRLDELAGKFPCILQIQSEDPRRRACLIERKNRIDEDSTAIGGEDKLSERFARRKEIKSGRRDRP